MSQRLLSACLLAASCSAADAARAADLPAAACQIFIEKIGAEPSSHGSGSIVAVVKVAWLGGGEFIERVGQYSRTQATDLGNAPVCGSGWQGASDWGVREALPQGSGPTTQLGEYAFQFPIYSGTVESQCPGFTYASSAAFFVQTNKNTYWLNPGLTPAQLFVLDPHGYTLLSEKGFGALLPTDRGDLSYYNPLGCR